MPILLFFLFYLFDLKNSYATDSFKYCVEGVVTQLDPSQSTDVMTENSVAQTVFNKLVDVDLKTGKVIPSLAERWRIDKNGRVYTFFLRKNVKFHSRNDFKPSRDFNGNDVIETFSRLREPPPQIKFGPYESFGLRQLIERIELVGDFEVRFVLKDADSQFLVALAHGGMSIHSAEYLKAKLSNESLLPIGTGPFVMQKFQTGHMLRLTAHPTHWEGTPRIKNLFIVFTPDSSVRVQKLKTGECDLIAEVPPADQIAMTAEKKLSLVTRVGLNTGYLGFNTERMKDSRVRRAIAHALNIDNYVSAVFLGSGVRAQSLLSKEMLGYSPDDAIDYNLSKSQKLKQEVEAESKTTFPRKLSLLVLPISRAYNPSGKKMAEIIQRDLNKIGLEVDLINYDWATFLDASRKGNFDMILIGANHHSNDPGIFLRGFFTCQGVGGFNSSRFCSKEFDELLFQAQATDDAQKRAKIYQRAMKVFMRELPVVPLAHGNLARASRLGLTDYTLGPAGRDNLTRVDIQQK